MSTTIRNIKVVIDGIQSTGFNITIDGNVYRMDNFTLSQHLLSPASLSFSIHRHEAEEDSKDATFQLSGRLIGKSIKLELSTDNVEAESSISEDMEKTAEVKFLGFIQNVSCSRVGTGYTLYVSATSWESILDTYPDCQSFENMTLKEILETVTYEYVNDYFPEYKMLCDTEYIDKIPYCVMYNESQLQFIQRLARRYSEWMYNDGEKLVFGKLPETESITLEYPGRDVESFSVDVSMVSHNFEMYSQSHYDYKMVSTMSGFYSYLNKFGDPKLSELQQKAYEASECIYGRWPLQHIESGGYNENDYLGIALNKVLVTSQARVLQSHMVRYSGVTYSSRIKIGCRLQIRDNIVMSNAEETHSDVNQEDILIIGMTHSFSADETYRNSFEGIPGICMYPPYPMGDYYPKSGPTRGFVSDNNDPEELGRVRVVLGYQAVRSRMNGVDELDDSRMARTPWIRVVQFYDTVKFIPEVGQEVLVDFENGNAERPYVVGSFLRGADPMDPEWTKNENENNEVKAIRSWNGHTVEFHDVGPELGGFIHVYDQAKKYDVLLSTDGQLVRLRSAGDIQLIAKKNILLKAGQEIGISSKESIGVDTEGNMDVNVGMSRMTSVGENDGLNVTGYRHVSTASEHSIFAKDVQVFSDDDIKEVATNEKIATNKDLTLDSKLNLSSKAVTMKEESQQFKSEAKTYEVDATANATIKSQANMEIDSQKLTIDGTIVEVKGKTNASISAPSVTIN